MREYREQKKGWSTEEWEMREYREQKKRMEHRGVGDERVS
jgi:hypothetical protein